MHVFGFFCLAGLWILSSVKARLKAIFLVVVVYSCCVASSGNAIVNFRAETLRFFLVVVV